MRRTSSALDLLLGSDITVMATLSLPAVSSLWWQLGITFSTNHFLALVLSGKGSEGRLNLDLSHTATSEAQHKMES